MFIYRTKPTVNKYLATMGDCNNNKWLFTGVFSAVHKCDVML